MTLNGIQLVTSFASLNARIRKFLGEEREKVTLVTPRSIPEYAHLVSTVNYIEIAEEVLEDIDPRWPIQCPVCLAYFTREEPYSCNCSE